ncbi:EMILIN-1-A-like isoform X2 [Festucalex cinctus]
MALLFPLLALLTCVDAKSAFPLRTSFNLYAGGNAHTQGARVASRHRNWCAYVATKTVSCVVEDGIETYVKPDYHPCAWGSGPCNRVVVYRTYMKPRYKVAYKMVTQMEWKCCQGYSGEDCSHSPVGGTGSTNRPQLQYGGSGMSTGQGGINIGFGQNGGHSGRADNEKMRQLEEKIHTMTKTIEDLQSTITSMNQHSQEGADKLGLNGSGGISSGARNPADAAQPEIKETIHSIQTKLDQLDNRTQAHDKTLVSINNHLVNGKGNDLEGGLPGGSLSGKSLNSLKEEILEELERRVSLSCSSCQAGVKDLHRQQQEDQERIQALEKQLNAMDVRYRQGMDGLRREVESSKRCCNTIIDLRNRVADAERKISSAAENFDVLHNRVNNVFPGGSGGSNKDGGFSGGEIGAEGGRRGSSANAVLTEDKLNNRLKDLELRVNGTMEQTEQSCEHLENDLKDYFHRELGDLRTVFLDRFDDQAFRITDVELDVGLVKQRVNEHDKTLSKLENRTSLLNRTLRECGCRSMTGGGEVGSSNSGRATTDGSQGSISRSSGGTGVDVSGTVGGGGLPVIGGEKDNSTRKSLEWRVIANEDQIRHFNTKLKDLSVSGDSLNDKVVDLSHDIRKIKALTGNHGEHFNRIVTEVELLGQDCEICGTVEDELRKMRNQSRDALGSLQNHVNQLQMSVDSGDACNQICSHLQDEVRLLREDVTRCTNKCGGSGSTGSTGTNGVTRGDGRRLDAERGLDGHSVIGGSLNNNQMKTLQGELSEVILTFSSINDTLKGLEHTAQKHGSVITDLGNTKDKIISELDKIQQEVTEHIEESRDRLDGMDRDVRRFESTMLVEMGDCKRSGDGLEKRLSKLEGVCGRLDTVYDSIHKIKKGLNQHVSSLWTCFSGLNKSIIHHGAILDFVQKDQEDVQRQIKNLNSSLNHILKERQSLADHTLTGLPGADAHSPKLSFSAALTVPMETPGTIIFDKIFVNEGDFYDPRTGIFTAPVDGHYFFSAILTGHKNEKIEAVLSKSNYGMARVDSGGYQPEGLENKPVAEVKTSPGSLAVFNIILPLQTKDTVCIDLVIGKLAHSVEPLTIFNGMLLYEDM